MTEVIEEKIPSQTHGITLLTYEQTQTQSEPDGKLGPFQDMRIPGLHVPNMFKPPTNNTIMNNDDINGGRRWTNKLLLILGGMVMTIIIAILVPYGISLFMNETYCDTKNNHISGSYYGLQSIMKCKPSGCPYQSEKCINGEVQCPENYTLDKYGVMCLNNENINEEFASQIAYKINYLFGVKLGENDCNYSNNSDICLDENELKTEIYKLYEDKDNDDLTGAWDMAIKGIIPNATTNAATDPTTNAATEPTTNAATDPTTNATTDPTTDSTTDATNATTNATINATTDATTNPTTNAATNAATDPTTNATTDPTTYDATADPTTDATTKIKAFNFIYITLNILC